MCIVTLDYCALYSYSYLQQQQQPPYGHFTGQSALAGISS